MQRSTTHRGLAATLIALGTVSALASAPTAHAAPSPSSQGHHAKLVCGTPKQGDVACNSQVLLNDDGTLVNPLAGNNAVSRAITGLTPSDIQSAYGLTGATSGGRTVAIVDAYGYPNAERDLAVYRAQFGLPACTVASGCLTIVNQSGGSTLPTFNASWAGEQALDLDAVSAACPDCKILLVQTTTASMANLGTGVNTAARTPGVVAISNSYGGGDYSDSSYGKYYNHPGIAVTASTGDNGYQGASYPASSRYVVAVGGTSLKKSTSARGWTESAWSGAGSGCSSLNAHPSGQSSSLTGCSGRAIADVSAVADPNTGIAVYAPTTRSSSSWAQYGGTSLSSPIVASVFALSGNTAGYANDLLYAAPASAFNDVTSGSNGTCTSYCTAKSGWDGPTGLGTPHGTTGF